MYQFYAVQGYNDALITSTINQEILDLNAGGTAAVNTVKRWAERQNREATASEIEEAFNSAINTLNDALDQLGEITVGQITTGALRAALAEFNMVDADGVVTSVENMADVYMSIY
jgi:hypothetical protein